jgi:protein-tyrosine kinase
MMSEFFKALEQAERDRLEEKEAGATTEPAHQAAPTENRSPVTEAHVTTPRSKPAPPKSGASLPASKPVPPKPEVSTAPPKPTSAKPEGPAPLPPFQAPSPASTYRPALRGRDRFRPQRGSGRRPPLLIAHSDPNSIEAEAFRTVRAKIELMASDHTLRHVAITSVTNSDGKSTSAANLACVAAQGGRRVCLVDGDLRRPTLHDLFGLPNVDGLASALAQGEPLHTVAKASGIENLSIVVAGRSPHESFRDLLTPQRLQKVLRDSEPAFDLVLFDTPPVISVADGLNVAAACDGVILVVRAGSVPFSVLRRAVEQIRHVKGRVLGVLLNRVDLRGADADYYRYYRAYHATGSKK